MPHEAVRFAHAGHLRLDSPLRGAGSLNDAARQIVEDATLLAFERLVDACIERDVEFVLLTPTTAPAGLTLRARRSLLRGFETLGEFGIRVYWLVGPDDAPVVTRDWPSNVTLLRSDEAAGFVRSGRVVATISGPDAGDRAAALLSAAAPRADERPFRIVLAGNPPQRSVAPGEPAAPHAAESAQGNRLSTSDDQGLGERSADDGGSLAVADYVACLASNRPTIRRDGTSVWHDPGPLQGLSFREPGAGGFSLIEAVAGRAPDVVRLAAAPVRWERCLIGVDPDMSRDELFERLQLALLEREPAGCETLWIVRWVIVGSGPLFETLEHPAGRDRLADALQSALGDGDRVIRAHSWELRPRSRDDGDPLCEALMCWLEQEGPMEWDVLSGALEEQLRGAGCAPAAARLRSARFADVRDAAAQLVRRWLASVRQNTA